MRGGEARNDCEKRKARNRQDVKEGTHGEAFPSLRQFYLHFNKKKGTCESFQLNQIMKFHPKRPKTHLVLSKKGKHTWNKIKPVLECWQEQSSDKRRHVWGARSLSILPWWPNNQTSGVHAWVVIFHSQNCPLSPITILSQVPHTMVLHPRRSRNFSPSGLNNIQTALRKVVC